MQLLKTTSKKGQVTLDSVIGLVVTLLVIGFLIGIALIMNEEFKEAADQWECESGYNMNGSACCQGGYPLNTTTQGECWNCTANTTDGSLCQQVNVGDDRLGNGTLTEGSHSAISTVNNSIGEISTAFSDIAGWMPLIALAVIAVIIIGLMMIFKGTGRRGM